MYLCYIDESGNTGNNLKDVHQPYLVLTALLVPPENIKDIENDIRTLGYSYFGAESRNTDFEFHGDDIYNARGKYFKQLPLERRIKIFDALVDITIRHEAIKIGYVSIEKGYFYSKYENKYHIQQTAFHLLIERIEERLKSSNSHCLLIADEQDELEQRLIDDLDHFKQHGTTFGYKKIEVERIIDSVHFVQSKNNYLMQLTDVLCYVIRRGKESNRKLLEEYEKSTSKEKFSDWLNKCGHKGHKYFQEKYSQLTFTKIKFYKNFPR